MHVPAFLPDNETVRSDIADYYFEVQRWDKDVGAAIELLQKTGELENTIIVMTGDHGMPFPRCKANLYDWGARIPLAIRWGDKIKTGRKITDFASFTDLAPTFLAAAGLPIPQKMTGNSLLPLLKAESDGRIDNKRNFTVFGRERHTPAQKIPSMAGYPARALRTDRWLFILNLEPDRWPAGVPTGASHPMDVHSDCDNGPSKEFIVSHKNDSEVSKYYELCFAKRPAVELYDCKNYPDHIHNLAAKPEFNLIVQSLRKRLINYLKATEDPRFTNLPAKFDSYPYNAGYLETYFREHGYE